MTKNARKLACTLAILLFGMAVSVSAQQRWAVRNNLIYDATLTPNVGIDYRLDSVWSVGFNMGLNAWDIDRREQPEHNKKWRHLLIAPELRHWAHRERIDYVYPPEDSVKARTSFWGLNLVYSHFNVNEITFPLGLYKAVRDNRLQGDLLAIGAFYGYSWRLSRLFCLETELGMAVGYQWSDRYQCGICGTRLDDSNGLFLLPKLGLNIVLNPVPKKERPVIVLPPKPVEPPKPVYTPVFSMVADNTGRAGVLQQDNPVLEHISKYRPYDTTRILRKEKGALYVHFPLAKSVLQHDFRDNALTLDRIVDITRQIMADTTSTVKKIQIIGLASIEGPVNRNEQLAGARCDALKQYIQQHVDTPDSLYDVANGGEAWTELRDQIVDSLANDKGLAQALQIIDSESNLDRREQQLRRLNNGRTWKYITDHLLKDQRNSGYLRIYYDYVPDSAAAIINRASELLRQQRYEQAVTMLHSVRADSRSWNTLGVALYMTGRHEEALDYFRRAAQQGNTDAKENLRQLE